MRGEGIDIIEIGKSRIGQRYHLGADVPLNNPNWNGPWDCAEFASWCAWQAYGLVFGAGRPKKIQNAEPYSGHWFDEAQDPDILVTVATALATPGALLIRRPRKELIGHVAISMGDGKRTLEARSKVHGVGIFSNAAGRPWDIGAFLPGVDYGEGAFVPSGDTPLPKSQSLAPGYLALAKPRMKGPAVAALQRVLTVKGVNPGPVDGVFGEMTHSAVISFQIERGLEVDGIVGPSTADALGLSMPITPLAEDIALFAQASGGHPGPKLPPSPGATVDLVTGIALQAGFYVATTASGVSFRFGKAVPYTDDMHRVGLNQSGKALTDVAKFGKYQVSDFPGAQSQWAHFILPTLTAEGDALYATLNSYDRAAFTFGAPQLAAHMANRNFGVYLRKLLRLENASQHFPELSLRQVGGEERVHLKLASGAFRNLEEPVSIIRPNGKKDEQAVHLMAYLNSDPKKVDDAELTAAARLINWLRLDRRVAILQIETFREMIGLNFAEAKKKVAGFDGKNWVVALWIMDILHQGRGTYAQIQNALGKADPADAVSRIGEGNYPARVKTVRTGVAKLAASGVMQGFTV